MPKIKGVAQNLLKESGIPEVRKGEDTIRLWEGYRDQAMLWRAIAVMQIPATFGAVILALILWFTRSIELNVPARPEPGHYAVQHIPDVEYVQTATEFVNLIASYQHRVARRQFEKAAEMVTEPLLQKFMIEVLGQELKAIETSARTQIFYIDPSETKVSRERPNEVMVTLLGSRQKLVAGKELPLVTTAYHVVLTTIPKQTLNPYGIVVTGLSLENVKQV